MAAEYPTNIKTFTDVQDSDYAQPSQWNEAYDEIEAIETELGTDPAGAYASVSERLDRVVCVQVTAGEALSDRDYVYIGASGKAYKSDADNETESRRAFCYGFVLGAVDADATAVVQFAGKVTGLTGLSAGSLYYASATDGLITSTAPSTYAKVVGMAVSSSELLINQSDRNLEADNLAASANITGATSISFAGKPHQILNMTGDVTLTASNIPASGVSKTITCWLTSTADRTFTFDSSWRWNGSKPASFASATYTGAFLILKNVGTDNSGIIAEYIGVSLLPGTYGYFVGGDTLVLCSNVAYRLTFSTSTSAACASANLTYGQAYGASCSDGVSYGYFAGGVTSTGSYLSSAYRITFSQSVTAAQTTANLSLARQGVAGLSSVSTYGYYAGGYSSAAVATAERLTFSTSTAAAQTTANLSGVRHLVGACSDGVTYGYFAGGCTNASSGYVVTADRITFSTSTTAAQTTANLSLARKGLAGLYGGATYGYFAGGVSSGYVVTADRITFSTSTTAAQTTADLSLARDAVASCSDGKIYGYFAGGYSGALALTTADRITFSTSTTAAQTTADLAAGRAAPYGLSDCGL